MSEYTKPFHLIFLMVKEAEYYVTYGLKTDYLKHKVKLKSYYVFTLAAFFFFLCSGIFLWLEMELTGLQGSSLWSKDCAIPTAPPGLVGHREDALALHCLGLPESGFFTSVAESLRALVLNLQELWLFQKGPNLK